MWMPDAEEPGPQTKRSLLNLCYCWFNSWSFNHARNSPYHLFSRHVFVFVLFFFVFWKYADWQRTKSALSYYWDLSVLMKDLAAFAAESSHLRRVFKCMCWLILTICLVSVFRNNNNNSAGVSDLQRGANRQRLELNTAEAVTLTVGENSHKVENNVFCSLGSWLLWLMLRKSNRLTQ